MRVNGDKGTRALIVIEEPALSRFLGDAENPAHSDWSERADKIRTLYDHGAWTLRFVKNSASFLASMLARPPAGRERDFLADLFSVELPEATSHADAIAAHIPIRGATGVSGSEGTSDGMSAGGNGGVAIARIAGGFTIKGANAAIGRPLRGEIAYRVRAGNPFRKHSPFDFDLLAGDDISVSAEGVSLRAVSTNGFDLVPTAAKFQISMKGFDLRRDLVVRVVGPDDAAETELH